MKGCSGCERDHFDLLRRYAVGGDDLIAAECGVGHDGVSRKRRSPVEESPEAIVPVRIPLRTTLVADVVDGQHLRVHAPQRRCVRGRMINVEAERRGRRGGWSRPSSPGWSADGSHAAAASGGQLNIHRCAQCRDLDVRLVFRHRRGTAHARSAARLLPAKRTRDRQHPRARERGSQNIELEAPDRNGVPAADFANLRFGCRGDRRRAQDDLFDVHPRDQPIE